MVGVRDRVRVRVRVRVSNPNPNPNRRQLEYADYRIEKDPARAMLQRLFGDEYSERLIREALFDLPRVLAAERRG